MIDNKKLIDEIVKFRAKNRLSQSSFAEMCGLTKHTIWSIENNTHNPTKMTIAKIMNVIEGEKE